MLIVSFIAYRFSLRGSGRLHHPAFDTPLFFEPSSPVRPSFAFLRADARSGSCSTSTTPLTPRMAVSSCVCSMPITDEYGSSRSWVRSTAMTGSSARSLRPASGRRAELMECIGVTRGWATRRRTARRDEGGAHAPSSVNRQTGMPKRRALSARFSVMPEPGKTMTPAGHDRQQLVVAAERSRLGVPVPVRLEGDLRDLAVLGPAGGDALGAARAAAVQQHHVGVLLAGLVERVPDPLVIVAVERRRRRRSWCRPAPAPRSRRGGGRRGSRGSRSPPTVIA